jgi:hypothetical protein
MKGLVAAATERRAARTVKAFILIGEKLVDTRK